MNIFSAEQLLNVFLKFIFDIKEDKDLLQRLLDSKMLDEAFEIKYLLEDTDTIYKITESIEKESDYWIFYLEAQSGLPYRAEIIKKDNSWKLKSFMFLCMGCFGEDEDCGVCGGGGWGVL